MVAVPGRSEREVGHALAARRASTGPTYLPSGAGLDGDIGARDSHTPELRQCNVRL